MNAWASVYVAGFFLTLIIIGKPPANFTQFLIVLFWPFLWGYVIIVGLKMAFDKKRGVNH